MPDKIPIARQAAQNAGFWTKKGLGQHLLRDSTVADDILKALNVKADEAVLEIGPGLGALTESLLKIDCLVGAIEVDPKACDVLKERFGDLDRLKLVQADVLQLDLNALCAQLFEGRTFHVAANLPYYITSPILAQVIEGGLPFKRMVTLCQKEVADRLAAGPGSKTYGALSVMAQFRCKVTLLRKVLPGAFTPPPKVDSGLLLFERREQPNVKVDDEKWFFRMTRAAFSKRRKTMRNGIRMGGLGLDEVDIDAGFDSAGLDPGLRPEMLSLQQFADIANAIKQP